MVATDTISRSFGALADPIRRDIIARLTAGDATVTELAAPYRVTIQAVSLHIKVLEEAGIVSRTRDAQRRPVHLERESLDVVGTCVEEFRKAAEERYRRLDRVLEPMPDSGPKASTSGAAR